MTDLAFNPVDAAVSALIGVAAWLGYRAGFVATIYRATMDSPGHRENILRPEFTRIGIGLINAGVSGRIATQPFITP